MSQTFRTFASIELSQSIRNQVQDHIERLKAAVPECSPSWSRVDNIHLTLKFFGDVEQRKIKPISDAASRTVKDCAPFEILISGTGAFPKLSQPRVLWIGVEDSEQQQLAELHRHFENESAKEGFDKEGRAFRPHLTTARIRKPAGARSLAELNNKLGFDPIAMPVHEIVVFRSELSSQGSKYTVLSRHPFG